MSTNSSRRESQQDWYHNRGRTKANITCEGSGKTPSRITDLGDYTAGTGSGRMKGTLPKGICPVCEDEISVNTKPETGTEGTEFSIRKHKDAKAPYKRSILLSEDTWRKLNLAALKLQNSELAEASLQDQTKLKNIVDTMADEIIWDSFKL